MTMMPIADWFSVSVGPQSAEDILTILLKMRDVSVTETSKKNTIDGYVSTFLAIKTLNILRKQSVFRSLSKQCCG